MKNWLSSIKANWRFLSDLRDYLKLKILKGQFERKSIKNLESIRGLQKY